jgi:hypothetical protein
LADPDGFEVQEFLMSLVQGLLDRAVLVGAVLAGGTLPSFMAQYRQRIGGQLEQVLLDLSPFQQIANLRHGGSLDALVMYHLGSADATFHDEGIGIRTMMDAVLRLREAVEGLSGGLGQQLWYITRYADTDVLRATWEVYQPSFSLTPEGLVFAASAGIVVWLLFLFFWWLVSVLFFRMRRI